MHSRRWAKYVAVIVMLSLFVPGLFLMASTIKERRDREAADEAAREERCAETVDALVTALDGVTEPFDGVNGFGADVVPPLPSMEQLRAEATELEEQLTGVGCRVEDAEEATVAWRDGTADSGALAEAVRAALAANVLDVLGGGAGPSTVRLGPGDDLVGAVARLPDKATLVLPPGELQVERPIVVVQELTIEGAGAEETTVTSSAGGAALVLASPVPLSMSRLGLSHVGDATASVALLRAGEATFEDVHLSGGSVRSEDGTEDGTEDGAEDGTEDGTEDGAEDGAEDGTEDGTGDAETDADLLAGGNGIVLAGARDLTLLGSTVADNAVAGVVAAGRARPVIRDTGLHDNGLCGVCYLGRTRGEVRESSLTRNGVGLMTDEQAAPEVHDSEVADNVRAGVVVEGRSRPLLRRNEIDGNGVVGVSGYRRAAPRIIGNTVRRHDEAGVLLDLVAGARPVVAGNRFVGNRSASLVFLGAGAGRASDNACTGSRFDLVLDGSATPVLRDNACRLQDQRG